MSLKVLVKHGNTAEVSSYVGISGELILNENTSMLHIADGSEAGGHPVLASGEALPVFTIGTASIIAPLNGATGVLKQPIIQGSAFVGDGTHAASYWQISANSGFTTTVYDSGKNTTRLLQLATSEVGVTLTANTLYYARVRYESSYGLLTAWSTPCGFTVKSASTYETEQVKLIASDKIQGDEFGFSVAISSDGNYAVIGARGVDGGGSFEGAAYVFTRTGLNWTQQAKLIPNVNNHDSFFGYSVAISANGATVAVSAWGDDTNGTSAGAVYVFTRTGTSWAQQAKLLASDGTASRIFGNSVAISGDGNTILVGALGADVIATNSGAGYIYTRSGSVWSERTKLTSAEWYASNNFGKSVALSHNGSIAVIGGNNGEDLMPVYIFTGSGSSWSQLAKVIGHDCIPQDYFGQALAASSDGSTVVVGSRFDSDAGTYSGSVYVFTRVGNAYTQQAKLTALDAGHSDYFGTSVSVSGDGNTVLIGAHLKINDGNGAHGASYIFKRNGSTWAQQTKLLPETGGAGDQYGTSVAISEDASTMIVSAPFDKLGAVSANYGSAYIHV